MDVKEKFRFSAKNLQIFAEDPTLGGNPTPTPTPTPAPQPQPSSKTFTQDEVNEIIGKRIGRETAAWLKKLGLEKEEDVESLVKNAKAYQEINPKFEALTKERDELLSEKANASYKRIAEKYTNEVDYVFSKVAPTNDEKAEDYEKRIVDFLKEHPSFALQAPRGQKFDSNFDFSNGRSANSASSLKDALTEKYKKK